MKRKIYRVEKALALVLFALLFFCVVRTAALAEIQVFLSCDTSASSVPTGTTLDFTLTGVQTAATKLMIVTPDSDQEFLDGSFCSYTLRQPGLYVFIAYGTTTTDETSPDYELCMSPMLMITAVGEAQEGEAWPDPSGTSPDHPFDNPPDEAGNPSGNDGCTLSVNPENWSPGAEGESRGFAITRHGNYSYSISITQYNSTGAECTNIVKEDDHRLAHWLTSSIGTGAPPTESFTLTAQKNYASNGKNAEVTLTCDCGATHSIAVNQANGEPAPAYVQMQLNGANGFTERSSSSDFAVADHSTSRLTQGNEIAVSVTAGGRARRVTFRVADPFHNKVYEDTRTTSETDGIADTFKYMLPSDAKTGSYTIEVYASNSVTAGDDAQFIYVASRIRVDSAAQTTTPHSSVNYPTDKIDFEDEIWFILINEWGLTDYQAAGFMSSIAAESSFSPYNAQNYKGTDNRTTYNYTVNDAVGFGLCQWTNMKNANGAYSGRKTRLYDYAVSKGNADLVWDFDTQMEFMRSEINLSTLKSKTSLYEAAEWTVLWHERPSQSWPNSWPGTRYETGKAIYKKHTGRDYVEPELSFTVTHAGANVVNSTGYRMDDHAAVGATGTLVVKSNYYWRLTKTDETVSDWLDIQCKQLYFPSKMETCVCGYAYDGNKELKLTIKKAPPEGETYSTALVFEIYYENDHTIKKVPVTLSYTSTNYYADSAVNYARLYAESGNPEWHFYGQGVETENDKERFAASKRDGSDCACFVSQCLIAGGLSTEKGKWDWRWGGYNQSWYDYSKDTSHKYGSTNSFTGAISLHNYLSEREDVTVHDFATEVMQDGKYETTINAYVNISDLSPGDIVWIVGGSNYTGRMHGHVVFVTEVAYDGSYFKYCAHSANYKDMKVYTSSGFYEHITAYAHIN